MNAFVLMVTAGYGPIEVCRFVAILSARLEEMAQAAGLLLEEVVTQGDEKAPRSVSLYLRGDSSVFASELGTHALLAQSPDRGKYARKRWYASVVLNDAPPVEVEASPLVEAKDLEITAMRASGPGGQNVNKTSTAVRVLHLPSGLIVRVADERSQKANLRRAVDRISRLLRAKADTERKQSETSRWSNHARLLRGAPVRTYSLSVKGDLLEKPVLRG